MISFSSRLGLKEFLENLQRADCQRRKVYLAVHQWDEPKGPSREDIARVTGMRLGSVCGRVADLLKDGGLARGPLKSQEVCQGHPVEVETLIALVYREAQEPQPAAQLELL